MTALSPFARRVIVVEDEPLLASLMATALRDAGFDVRHCLDATHARELVDEFDPDAVLTDVYLGERPTGLYLAHVIRRLYPEIGVLVVSRHSDVFVGGREIFELPPGARFLPKNELSDTDTLIAAVESVLSGSAPAGSGHRRNSPLWELTPTQRSVLRAAAAGLTNSAIAEERNTTERSVERLFHAIYQALGIRTDGELNPRVEAIRFYVATAGVPDRDTYPDADRDELLDLDVFDSSP